MTAANRPPRIPGLLLEWFLPHNAALAGDLEEEHRRRDSIVWYWRQVLAAIALHLGSEVRAHKLLAIRAVATGWAALWLLSFLEAEINRFMSGWVLRAEIPDLIELQRAHAQELVVVGVVVMDRFGDNVRRFASELEMNYPIVDATSRPDVEEAYGPMWGLPTTFVIGRDGAIIKKRSGIGSREQFERDVKALF